MAPSKKRSKRKSKSSKDAKQDRVIRKMQQFLDDTIETKIVDFNSGINPINVSVDGYMALAFFRQQTGLEPTQGGSTAVTAEGPHQGMRIGKKVTLLNQTWNIELLTPAYGATTENYNKIRLLIVENLDYTSVTDLELTDVLEYGNWSSNKRQVFISPYKKKSANNRRFKVMYDKVFTFDQSEKALRQIKYKHKYGTRDRVGKVLTFNEQGDLLPANHRVVMFAISDSADPQHPQIMWNCRSRYQDA